MFPSKTFKLALSFWEFFKAILDSMTDEVSKTGKIKGNAAILKSLFTLRKTRQQPE